MANLPEQRIIIASWIGAEDRDGMGFVAELVLTEQSDGWPADNEPQLLLKKHTKL
jgi:hypothetical protein